MSSARPQIGLVLCMVSYIIFLTFTLAYLRQIAQQHLSIPGSSWYHSPLISREQLVLHDSTSLSQNDRMNLTDRTATSRGPNQSYEESKLYHMATLMANDDDFAVFRKFSELNFFNLLHIQHCLAALEKDLCKKFEDGLSVSKIAVEIRQLLKDYNAAYLALSVLKDAPKPIDKTLSDIKQFSDNNIRDFDRELGNMETMLPYRLMSLTAKDKSWAHNFVNRHQFLRRIFMVEHLENVNPGKRYFSDTKFRSAMAKTERFLITLGFCLLILGPVYWLSYTKDMHAKIGIVAGFVVCVSLLTAGFTRAQYWEIGTVTAGYSAILVVFLGSGLGSSS